MNIKFKYTIRFILLSLGFALLGAVFAVSAIGSPIFNEVVFDPLGNEPDGECIEIYNDSDLSIDMKNYVLTNQNGFLYTFPDFILNPDSYAVVHVGTGTDTDTDLYAGETTEQLDNYGDDLLLQDSSGYNMDYIAYGAGPGIDPCPAGLLWSNDIDINTFTEGESIGLYPDGTDKDKGTLWYVLSTGITCEAGPNGQQADPVVAFLPDASLFTSPCTDIQFIVSVENIDLVAPLFGIQLVVTIPPDYYYISSIPSGAYNQENHTITWELDDIARSSKKDVELHIQASCSAVSGSALQTHTTFYRYEGGIRESAPDVTSGTISIYDSDITIAIGEYATGDKVIWKEKEKSIEYKITVSNNGTNDIPGMDLKFTMEKGLTLLSLKNDGPNGSTVNYTSEGNVYWWETDPINSSGNDIFYVRVQSTACANLESNVEIVWGCADYAGSPSCSGLSRDTVLVRCPITYEITNILPAAGGTLVNACQDLDSAVVIRNNDEYDISDASLVLTLPGLYYYVASSPEGNYNPEEHTITFDEGAIGTIPGGGGTQTVRATLRPSCNAKSQEIILPEIIYAGGTQRINYPVSEDIPLGMPAITISMEDDNNPGSTAILAARGEIVTFRINVINSGDGDLVTGADLRLILGDGLIDRVFRDRNGISFTPGGSGTTDTPYTWNSGQINSDSSTSFTIEVKINNCNNLINEANFSWGCKDEGGPDTCLITNDSKSSVKIELKTPYLAINPDTFTVPWCSAFAQRFEVSNDGDGSARHVMLNLEGLDIFELDIAVTADSDFSFDPNTSNFILSDGSDTDNDGKTDDIASGDSYLIEFTVQVKEAACGASGTGGILIYNLIYYDDCDIEYDTGTAVSSYSVNTRPSLSISKSDLRFADVRGTLNWTITVMNYSASDITGVTVIDNYPDANDTPNGYGNFTVNNPDGGTDDLDKITWANQTIPANGTWIKNITLNAPTNTCAGGNSYTNTASITFEAIDCRGCEITGNGSSASDTVFINNDQEDILDTHDRSVEYINYNTNRRYTDGTLTGKGETCSYAEDGYGNIEYKGGLKITAFIDFGAGPSVPGSWTNTHGTVSNIIFTENLNHNLQIPDVSNSGDNSLSARLGLEVTYGDMDVTSYVKDNITDNGNNFTIDLGEIDNSGAGAPNAGHMLQISYILHAPDEASGSFNTTHTITIPNNEANCYNPMPEDFDQGVLAYISKSSASINISKLTGSSRFVDKCEIATYRLAVSATEPWTMYDVIVELDLDGDDDGIPNYQWIAGAPSEAFIGFTDEGDRAIPWSNPAQKGNILTWNLGDLNTNGYIELDLKKVCSDHDKDIPATVYSHTNCTNGDDSGDHTDNAASYIFAPTILREGRMEIMLVPENYHAKTGYPQLRLYVVNSGNGYLYNMKVPLAFDNKLEYYDSSMTDQAGESSMNIIFNDNSHVTFEFDKLAPGHKLYVDLILKMSGCSSSLLNVYIENATWWCSPQTQECNLGNPLNARSTITMSPSDIMVIEHKSEPKLIDYCGSLAMFTIKLKNLGTTEAYEIIAEEILPLGISLFESWTPEYRVDLDGDGWDNDWTDFPNPGGYTSYNNNVITWNFMDPDEDNNETDSIIVSTDGHETDNDGLRHYVLKPRGIIIIRFKGFIHDCPSAADYYSGEKRLKAMVRYDEPCDHENTGPPLSETKSNILSEFPAIANVDIYKEGQNATGGIWDSAWTNGIIHALPGHIVNWRFELRSNGQGNAPVVILKDILPPNVIFTGNYNDLSSSGISVNALSGDGSAANPLTFFIANSTGDDPATADIDEGSYLPVGASIIIQIETMVKDNACDNLQTNLAAVSWGCCGNTDPGETSGENTSAADLITRPLQSPLITIMEKPGYEFTTCGGAYRITIQNPNKDYTYYGFKLSLPETGNFVYDNTSVNGVKFSYTGNLSRSGRELTEAEEEPQISGGIMLWQGKSEGGNIPDNPVNLDAPDNKAVLLPDETITIDLNLYTKGDSICDSGPDNDIIDPYDTGFVLNSFVSTLTGAFTDYCGNPVYNTEATVNVNPEQPDADIIELIPDKDLAKPGDVVRWQFAISNKGDAPAANLEIKLILGDGYEGESVSRVSGSPAEDFINTSTRVVTWDRGSVSLDAIGGPNSSRTWIYQATVKPGGGDLSAAASIDGFCSSLNSNDICRYTFDQKKTYLMGAEIRKIITRVNAPARITTPSTADATIGNVITYTIEAYFYDNGPFTNVQLIDVIPEGMKLISSSYLTGTGGLATPDGRSGGTYTWTPGNGLVSSASVYAIKLLVRVADEQRNDSGTELENTASLSFNVHGSSYGVMTHPSDLQKTNMVTVRLPAIRNDADYTKTADPPGDIPPGSPVRSHDNIRYTFTAKNTGETPAYEMLFIDLLPRGMRKADPSGTVVVGIDSSGDMMPERILSDTNYTLSYSPSSGELKIAMKNSAYAALASSEKLIITYQSEVDPNTGIGVEMNNSARIVSYTSLPGKGNTSDSEQDKAFTGPGIKSAYHHTPSPAAIDKAVYSETSPPNKATIGEALSYLVTFQVPEDTMAYDINFLDILPDGLTVRSASYSYEDTGGGQPKTGALQVDNLPNGQTIVESVNPIGDIGANAVTGDNTIRITIEATVNEKYFGGTNVQRTDKFSNLATFTWNMIDEDNSSARMQDTNIATVTVIEPFIAADADYAKKAIAPLQGAQVKGGDSIRYAFTAKNSGDSPAHELVFVDILPEGMRMERPVINSIDIQGAALAEGDDYDVSWEANEPGELRITLHTTENARMDSGEKLTVDYTAKVSNKAGVNAFLMNNARVESFTSLPGVPVHHERVYPRHKAESVYHRTASPVVRKTVQSTVSRTRLAEVDLNNASCRGTLGEEMIFRLKYKIPVNTTVYDLRFSDTVPDGLTVREVYFTHNEKTSPCDSIPIEENGATRFMAVPVFIDGNNDFAYKAVTGESVIVAIHCTVDLQHSDGTPVPAGKIFSNTGSFRWNYSNDNPDTLRGPVSESENFTVIEPALTNFYKTVKGISTDRGTDTYYRYLSPGCENMQTMPDIYTVLPGDIVTYRLTVENSALDANAYDILLVDTLPEGMSYDKVDSVSSNIEGNIPSAYDISGSELRIMVDHLSPRETLTVVYSLKVDNGVAIGRVLTNSSKIEDFSTLPGTNQYNDYDKDTDSTPAFSRLGPVEKSVGVKNTDIITNVYRMYDDNGNSLTAFTESVRGKEVRLGEILQYEIELGIWNNTSFLKGGGTEDFIFRVALPTGVQRLSGEDEFHLGTLSAPLTLSAGGVSNSGTAESQVWEWRFSDITNNDGADKRIKLVFKCVITNDHNNYNDNSMAYPLDTGVRVVWDTTPDGECGDIGENDMPGLSSSLSYTLTQPDINNDHTFTATPACGSTVAGRTPIEFTFDAINSGSFGDFNAPAYDIVFIADIPLELRDSAGPRIQTLTLNGSAVTEGHFMKNWDVDTGEYTVRLLNHPDTKLLKGEHLVIAFMAQVDPGIGTDTLWATYARIDSYTSFPDNAGNLSGGVYPDKERYYGIGAGETDPVILTCAHNTTSTSPVKSVTMRQTAPALDPLESSDNSGRATIGERVTYHVRLDVPEDTTIYDLEFSDKIPDGLTAIKALWEYGNPDGGDPVTGQMGITGNPDGTYMVNGIIGDVRANTITGKNRVHVRIISIVDQTFIFEGAQGDINNNGIVDETDIFENKASMTWNRKDGDPNTGMAKQTNPVTFSILEPRLSNLTKSFDPGAGDLFDSDGGTIVNREKALFCYYDGPSAPNMDTSETDIVLPDDYMRFTIKLENTGSSAAYDINMVARVPNELSYNKDIEPLKAYASDGDDPNINIKTEHPLDIVFSHLNPGQMLTVVYLTRVNRLSGAGRYMENTVKVIDYDTLDSSHGEEDGIPDMITRERDTDSTPAYSDLGPVVESAGIQPPDLGKTTFRLYDAQGKELQSPHLIDSTGLSGTEARIGERIRYRLTVTVPRRARLFDGNNGHIIFFDKLPPGFKYVTGSDDYTQGDIVLTGTGHAATGVSSNQETNLWRFNDIENNSDTMQTAVLQFDVVITNTDTGSNRIYTDNKITVHARNEAYLYWDTEETTGSEPGSGDTADCPYRLSSDIVNVAQPDLNISKDADDPDNYVIPGQVIHYTVSIPNNTTSGTMGIGYDANFQDTLPPGMRQTAPRIMRVEIQDASGITVRTLAPDHDYYDTIGSYSPSDGKFQIITHFDTVNNDYDSRIEPNEKLVIIYTATVDSTAGTMILANEAYLNSFFSLRSGINDPDRKKYGPSGPVYKDLQSQALGISKTASPAPGSLVMIDDTINYTLVVPFPVIGSKIYDIKIVDEIPDGLEIVDPRISELGAGDIRVYGATGVTVSVSGLRNRKISIAAAQIDEDDGDMNDEPYNPGGDNDSDQIIVNITAKVRESFDNGQTIPFYHEFENLAGFYWHTKAEAPRTRYFMVSEKTSHILRSSGMIFQPDHTETAHRGTIKIYRHIILNLETLNDDIRLDYGSSSQEFPWIIYKGDGSGNIVGSPIGSGSTITVTGNKGAQEIIARAFIPTETPQYTTDIFKITVTGIRNSHTVTDITTILDENMSIRKEISNDNIMYSTNLDVENGQEIFHRLTFYVNGQEPVTKVYIYDFIPEYTSYIRGSSKHSADLRLYYSTDGGVSWIAGEPPTDIQAKLVTNLRWEYIGNEGILLPGDIKQITFKILIE